MTRGGFWCLGGLVATFIGYSASAPGGTYMIWWGAIVWGAIEFFRGRTARTETLDLEGNARALLKIAARLESIDRAKAVETYREIRTRFPGTRASREAQRNIKTLMSSSSAS